MTDGADALWRHCCAVAAGAREAVLGRAADCVALGIAEMVASRRDARWRRVAEGLGAGAGGPGWLAADAFLMHAQLADDSYRLAEHPGLAVLPAALAAAEADRGRDGRAWLGAVAGGYEAACRLADLVLPDASERGWRVTAAIAPAATAVTEALLRGGGFPGADATRLALACSGGPLGVFGGGDAWRVQPALASVLGRLACEAAAAGAVGAVGALEGEQGMVAVLTGRRPAGLAFEDGPRIMDVTFKRHPVPMYGQAVFDALERAPALSGQITAVRVRVPPFAAAYADQDPGAVTSVAAITRAALARRHPGAAAPATVEVVGDPALGMLDAVVEMVVDGRAPPLRFPGTGDTSGWTAEDAARHCAERIGEPGVRLAAAARAALGGSPAELVEAWRALH